MIQRLFVYGTLAPGRENHYVLEKVPGVWEPATLRGFLLDKGWGAAMGYPGIMPSDEGGVVKGWVLTSTELADCWKRIDTFEGDGYKRISAEVIFENGSKSMAYVYAIRV
ncbi:gamma-glutamylcyclotransferase [Endozoicomonas sp. SCSIO W0465]|uniref:gamma-glutamylcyclotransferase family protein n=1 Tax=Endozoicomonas sp. SCSIO W0465 TaxID=2918516 RepID=UPI002075E352|nr:gamma-glutamylcyclotransferase family protein [Endozoicomonas sp. SCSIO W0465]USE38165.1 gamma-glutamylcyclotransferase [Endozoicomonas sp. SCSIO W0465]